jgi:hypothetical protein
MENETFYITNQYKHRFIEKVTKKKSIFLFENNFFCFFAFFLKFESIFYK